MRLNVRLTGFSIAEALVAAMVFSIAAVGVFSTISSIQKPTVNTDRSLQAAYIGQQVLEGLRSQVNGTTWNTTGGLALGPGGAPRTYDCSPAAPINNITYQCTYTVTQAASGARSVTANVTWP